MDHLTLSFNTGLRQVVFEENIQALNTVLAVKRGYNREPKEEET